MNVINGSFVFCVVYFVLFLIFRSRPQIAAVLTAAIAFGSVLGVVSERFSSDTTYFLKGGVPGVILMFLLWALLFREKKKAI